MSDIEVKLLRQYTFRRDWVVCIPIAGCVMVGLGAIMLGLMQL